jgi:putative nucleotidyltransferase with HDIG domain
MPAATPSFDELLPIQTDPVKAGFRRRLLQVLESSGEILPSASSPRGKLWHLVNSPGSSLEDCADVIQLDSALAARILKVANSGTYALNTDSITGAILQLGLRFVREQVFSATVFKQYSAWVLPPEWDVFWLRNIFVARLSERITGSYGTTTGSEYLAGLLHDVGWLFLVGNFPDEYAQMVATGWPLNDVEKQIIPYSHAEISAAIAARSLLPQRLIDAILHHHHPLVNDDGSPVLPDKKANATTVVLSLCDDVADTCGMNVFAPAAKTLEELQDGPQMTWLKNFGKPVDLRGIAEAELAKSKDIFEAYFSNKKFQ